MLLVLQIPIIIILFLKGLWQLWKALHFVSTVIAIFPFCLSFSDTLHTKRCIQDPPNIPLAEFDPSVNVINMEEHLDGSFFLVEISFKYM